MKGEKPTGFEGRVLEETNERESETGELVHNRALTISARNQNGAMSVVEGNTWVRT